MNMTDEKSHIEYLQHRASRMIWLGIAAIPFSLLSMYPVLVKPGESVYAAILLLCAPLVLAALLFCLGLRASQRALQLNNARNTRILKNSEMRNLLLVSIQDTHHVINSKPVLRLIFSDPQAPHRQYKITEPVSAVQLRHLQEGKAVPVLFLDDGRELRLGLDPQSSQQDWGFLSRFIREEQQQAG
ncbi:hypothetical protein W822_17725 [Advenella kashmirensis W13003]|uniref:Uncharacterized protein n=2 Tax=Advenella kashmirensis TaxID=310575 RepID=V8QPX8_9BURK|nr:hypothetical protein W822_17725 [Advenella kashmirensis W13003]